MLQNFISKRNEFEMMFAIEVCIVFLIKAPYTQCYKTWSHLIAV